MKNTKNTFEIQLFSEGTTGEAAADDGQESKSCEDTACDNEFGALIKGKYKDAFAQRVQTIIDKRFRETKSLEEYKAKTERIIAAVGEKHGVAPVDLDALLAAVTGGDTPVKSSEVSGGKGETSGTVTGGDTSVKSSEVSGGKGETSGTVTGGDTSVKSSEVSGGKGETSGTVTGEDTPGKSSEISGDKVDTSDTVTGEDAERAPDSQKAERRERASRQYARWQRESRELSRMYPEFSLEDECRNPEFLALLMGGASVKSAFEGTYHDRIMASAMEYTAKTVAEGLSRKMTASGARPFENGLVCGTGISPSKSVDSLTDKDIVDILRQVAKGKIIRF